jgi:hypothetical protein
MTYIINSSDNPTYLSGETLFNFILQLNLSLRVSNSCICTLSRHVSPFLLC